MLKYCGKQDFSSGSKLPHKLILCIFVFPTFGSSGCKWPKKWYFFLGSLEKAQGLCKIQGWDFQRSLSYSCSFVPVFCPHPFPKGVQCTHLTQNPGCCEHTHVLSLHTCTHTHTILYIKFQVSGAVTISLLRSLKNNFLSSSWRVWPHLCMPVLLEMKPWSKCL